MPVYPGALRIADHPEAGDFALHCAVTRGVPRLATKGKNKTGRFRDSIQKGQWISVALGLARLAASSRIARG
jgi:hypothetical protein